MITGRVGRYRWLVLTIIFLTFMISFGDRINIGVLLPILKDEFAINNLEAGALASFFFLGYAVVQIPAGFWFSRYGTRGLVAVAMLAVTLFTFLIGQAYSTVAMKWYRFGLGFAQGPVSVGCMSTINNWFPAREKGTAVGFYIAAYMVATIIVPPICAWLVLDYGWRLVFYWFAIPSLVMSAVWYVMIRTRPEECRHCLPQETAYIRANEQLQAADCLQPARNLGWLDVLIRARKVVPLLSAKQVFTSGNVWGATIGYFCMMSVMYGLLTWIPSYLVNARGYSFLKMGFVAAAPWVGGFMGSVFGGWFSDRILLGRRKPMMLLGTLLTGGMMWTLIYVPENVAIIAVVLFLTGFVLNLAVPLFTTYPMGLASQEVYPVTIALINSAGNLGGFFSPMIAGALLDTFQQYEVVFVYLSFCMLVALVALLLVEEPLAE